MVIYKHKVPLVERTVRLAALVRTCHEFDGSMYRQCELVRITCDSVLKMPSCEGIDEERYKSVQEKAQELQQESRACRSLYIAQNRTWSQEPAD